MPSTGLRGRGAECAYGGGSISAPCANCGRQPGPDDRFCGRCGTELALSCPQCARALPVDAAFCTACGVKVGGTGSGALGAPSQEDRRRISVLFVDLIDFTPYVERSDPELVRGLQTGFFAAARRVVGQYGGVVEKYIGDAVMALFGAPVATETDALRCVRAGLELQRVLARFAPSGADGLQFRVGVATGEALVDVAAAHDGGQAIVAGDVVNTASRLQSVAPPGGVLVCGPTYALTRDGIGYEERPPITLRGRSTPTEVWLALRPAQPPAPEPAADASPFVDREHELGMLANAAGRVTRERMPRLVTVFGRAGIGKSRLMRELRRETGRLELPMTWRVGRCPPFGENVNFAALADIVKAEAGILDTDHAAAAGARLEATVREVAEGAEADRLIAALRPLIGLPGTNLAAKEIESGWRRFLIAVAARRPTVLVFEDLHWADEAMLRFVELLGASARDVPLLLLCTARPELIDRDPSWAGSTTGSLTITLPPLRDSGVVALYAHMFDQAVFPAEMIGPLVEVAGGNPLYAHEYVRMLIEQGFLHRIGRGWTLSRPQELPIPDSVHSVIANRIDLLDPADRAVLLTASVVGSQFWPGAIAAALGQPVEAVERSLRRLEQSDFVHEESSSSMAGQAEFRFGHVLVRDVCYQRLPRTERVTRHERTADWLDELSRDTDLAEVLAHHRWAAYEITGSLGLDTDRYAPATRDAMHRAARRAYALHALDAAAAHISCALELAAGAEPLERLRLELLSTEIAFHRDGAGFLSGGGEGRLTTLAERLFAAGDQAGAARAWTLLGKAAWLRADRGSATARFDRAVELFDELPDTVAKADAYGELGRLHMLNLERDAAVSAAGAAALIAEGLGLVETAVNARITVAMARYQGGDPAGLAELREITDYCRSEQLLALPRAAQNLCHALAEEGDWIASNELIAVASGGQVATGYSDEAMRAYFEGDFHRLLVAADAFVDTPAGAWDMQVRGTRAVLRVLRDQPVPGSAPDGTDDVTAALETARRSGFHRTHWAMLGHGALCRALQGRTGEAHELLDELVRSWLPVPALASGEWLTAATYAAALSGRGAIELIRQMLERVEHHTVWTEAAGRTVAAVTAGAAGDHRRAARLHTAAAGIYAGIPDVTDRFFSSCLAVGELRRGAEEDARLLAEIRAFTARNEAPGLLRLALGPVEPEAAGALAG